VITAAAPMTELSDSSNRGSRARRDAGETSQSQQGPYPVTDIFKYVEPGGGPLWMRPEGVTCFAGDLPEEEQKLVWATITPRLWIL